MPRLEQSTFSALVETCGLPATAALCERYSGGTIHVPAPSASARGATVRQDLSQDLIEALGSDAAFALCERWQGEALYVPMARGDVAAFLHSQGVGAGEIARRLSVSASSARRYVRNAREVA